MSIVQRNPKPRSRAVVPDDPRDVDGDFAHAHPIEVRLADTDAMGHVNNAAYLTYMEIGRAEYYERVTGEPFQLGVHGAEEGMILAEIRVTYRSQAYYGETLLVETRVERIGRSSFTMTHRLTTPDSRYGGARLIAVADSVLVSFDYRVERPIPVPPAFAEAMEEFEGRPLRS